jgi:hypothetical protein
MLQPLLTFEPDQAEWHEVVQCPHDPDDLTRLIDEADLAAGKTDARYVVQGQPGDGGIMIVRFADEAARNEFFQRTVSQSTRNMSWYLAGKTGSLHPKD